ncbi:homing endonuclease associated repeat-containing protein [Haloglomus litoreum]|uniref:homing endonuclease associated repeat-containing protein n=1 Tax=Haloglomus litoreum TaxID=3034026 RepID=UPI0023E842A7|nr:HNH endonuclease [Haloglomus sp. DT116]
MVAPIPRAELIRDLQRVAEEVGEPPSGSQYDEHGEYSTSALYREFDGIPAARDAAGLDSSDQRGGANEIDREALLDAIHDLRDELGRTPRRTEMLEHGRYSETPFQREFGSWGAAVVAAGYEPYRPNSEMAKRVAVSCAYCGETRRELESQVSAQENWFCCRECKHRWQAEHVVGEQHHQYDRVTAACEWCDRDVDKKPAIMQQREIVFCDLDCYSEWCSQKRTGPDSPRWKGGGDLYYGPNWQRQRRARLELDDNTCQWCGRTESDSVDEFDRGLSVHHRKPVREFHDERGDIDWEAVNTLDNLVTLCLPCHRRIEKLPVRPQFD